MKKRALISVYNKKGVVELAKKLEVLGWEIISTGGTAKVLAGAGIKIIPIEEITRSPEAFSGRMKTISFQVSSAILFDRENKEHVKQAKDLNIKPIDMIVCNLYPFEDTVADSKNSKKEIIEMIDIGGPTMIRAAAKNFRSVIVVVDPKDYKRVISKLEKGGVSSIDREILASKVFRVMANYNRAIDQYLSQDTKSELIPAFSPGESVEFRYGENPHQKAWFYGFNTKDPLALSKFKKVQGKDSSFNNYLDADGALNAIVWLGNDRPACIVVKHTNPCGAAIRDNILEAFKEAWDGDSLAAFGGIIAVNREVDEELAEEMLTDRFFEVLLAPSISREAKEIFAKREKLIILINPNLENLEQTKEVDFKRVRGGMLVQEQDTKEISENDLEVVTNIRPTQIQIEDMLFAWKICRASKSNTIVMVKDQKLIGSGVGQQDRKRCCELAVSKAGEMAKGAVVASDAFFPFADGPELLAKAGVSAIIQPGGSIKDQEVVGFCNKHKIPMVFTRVRCFRH